MQELFLELVKLSLIGSLFALAVMAVRLIFRKAPKWIFCVLWGIVALRLIVPISIESDLSLVPDRLASGQIIANVGNDYVGEVDIIYESNAGYSNAINAGRQPIYSGDGYYVVTEKDSLEAPKTVGETVYPVLSWVWLAGMVLMLAYTVISYLVLKRKMEEATLLRDNIWQCEQTDSPFVLGIIRPRIYLPYAITESDMENVIAHEQAHIRRKDHWWKPIGFLLLSIHWFNPVMWLAYILLCRDIEAACDEKVIKHMEKDEMRAYSTALLHCSVHRRRIAACPLAFGEVGVKERIKRVMNYKKPAFWIIILVVVASIVVSVLLLTIPTTGNNLIRKIVNQKGYTIFEQQAETITLSVPVSSLPEGIFSEEGVEFSDGEIIAYQDETVTIFLKSAQLSNEGTDQLYLCFDFIFDLPKDGGKTIYPFEVQQNGLTDAVRVTDGSVRADNQVFDAAVSDRGQGSFEKIWFYLSVDAMGNAEGRIEFDIQLNTLSYLKDGKKYEEVFNQGETEEKLLLLVEEIINNPDCAASSNPFTYIEARKEQYNEILTYGSKAVDFFVKQLRTGENGLKGYIMAVACADITGIGDKDLGADWATAQEWLVLYEKSGDNTVVGGADGPSIITTTRSMTLDDVFELGAKGDKLTWEDLKEFSGRDIGSGLYVIRYDIDSDFYLLVGDGKLTGTPMYAMLCCVSGDQHVDILTGDVKGFIDTYRPSALDCAISDAIAERYHSSEPEGLIHTQSYVLIENEIVSGTPLQGQDNHVKEITVYLLVKVKTYSVGNNTISPVEGGKAYPTMIRFGVDSAESYKLLEYWTPSTDGYVNGEFDPDEVRGKFPENIAQEVLNLDKYETQLNQICDSKALAYLSNIENDSNQSLDEKYSEYFQLNTDQGLEVYVYQMAAKSYSCVLVSGRNSIYTWDELLGKPSTTLDEMRQIVQSYRLDRGKISIIPRDVLDVNPLLILLFFSDYK